MVQASFVKPKIVIVCGPTGVGKTNFSIWLAQKIDAEIVAADSQTILKKFNIGTAKPSREELLAVPHHLMNVASFDEVYDAATYAKQAREVIDSILKRGKKVLVCGGTGLYIKALLSGLIEAPPRNEVFRKSIELEISQKGLSSVYQKLVSLDAVRAAQIHPHDQVRIIRALELIELTQEQASQLNQKHAFQEMAYHPLFLGLNLERTQLYEQINQRVIKMIKEGWIDEVKQLLEEGYDLVHSKTQSIGYALLAKHLLGELSLEEAIYEIQKQTRHLAKRQIAWFRANKEIQWFEPSQKEEMLNCVKRFFE